MVFHIAVCEDHDEFGPVVANLIRHCAMALVSKPANDVNILPIITIFYTTQLQLVVIHIQLTTLPTVSDADSEGQSTHVAMAVPWHMMAKSVVSMLRFCIIVFASNLVVCPTSSSDRAWE